MFKREASKNVTENYCPVLQLDNFDDPQKTAGSTPSNDAAPDAPVIRGEIFILAANIYTRARRNTRARAAGIL